MSEWNVGTEGRRVKTRITAPSGASRFALGQLMLLKWLNQKSANDGACVVYGSKQKCTKVFNQKTSTEELFDTSAYRLEDVIKVDMTEIRWDDVNLIKLDHGRARCGLVSAGNLESSQDSIISRVIRIWAGEPRRSIAFMSLLAERNSVSRRFCE